MVSFSSSLKRFKNFPINFSPYFNSPKRMIVIKNTNVICRFNLICINREEVTYFLKIFVIVFKFQKLGSRKFVERARGALRERVSKIELAEWTRLILGARHVLRNFYGDSFFENTIYPIILSSNKRFKSGFGTSWCLWIIKLRYDSCAAL